MGYSRYDSGDSIVISFTSNMLALFAFNRTSFEILNNEIINEIFKELYALFTLRRVYCSSVGAYSWAQL